MNKQRRKELEEVISDLELTKGRLEILAQEEQDYFDNMPEGLQGGEKGEKAENTIGELEDAASSLEDVISTIQAAIE